MGLSVTMDSIPDQKIAQEAAQPGDSQTAADFIGHQLSLEQDAREVLPYVSLPFSHCSLVLTVCRNSTNAHLTSVHSDKKCTPA